MAQRFPKKLYNSSAWKNLARNIRERQFYRCQVCGALNATAVHHIHPLTPENVENPRVALNPDNLILLCADCHNKVHDRAYAMSDERPLYSFDASGHVVGRIRKEEADGLTAGQRRKLKRLSELACGVHRYRKS